MRLKYACVGSVIAAVLCAIPSARTMATLTQMNKLMCGGVGNFHPESLIFEAFSNR